MTLWPDLTIATLALLAIERAIDVLRANPTRFQRRDLILHESNQGTENKRHAFARERQRRQLIAQALARSGGQNHQRVASTKHAVDDLLLERVQALEPKTLFEDPGLVISVQRAAPFSRTARFITESKRSCPPANRPCQGCCPPAVDAPPRLPTVAPHDRCEEQACPRRASD